MRKQILIVDDSGVQLEIIKRVVIGAGYSVATALGGKDAIQLLEKNIYDLVLTDLEMPRIDGAELLRHIGNLNPGQAVGIISSMDCALLAASEELAKLHGLQMIGTFQKPLDENRFKTILLDFFQATERSSDQYQKTAGDFNQEILDVKTVEEGLKAGALDVVYQPKVSCASGEVIGYEALARWKKPDGSILGPASFLQTAEDNGLMDLLTDKVFEKAVAQAIEWREKGFNKKISINISVKNLSTLKLPNILSSLFHGNALSPSDFILEITETNIMHDWAFCLEILTRLRLLGFGLSVDDFGTGYASFDRLKFLPFTELKLDRSYISKALEDPASLAMLQTGIDVSKRFNVESVAEGVETEAQFKLLKTLGVDMIQGYYFSRPLPADLAHDFALTLSKQQETVSA